MSDVPGPGVPYTPPPRSQRRSWGDFRKLHRAGHGVAFSLPPSACEHLGVTAGQHVLVALGDDGTVTLSNPRDLSRSSAERLSAAETISSLRALVMKYRRRLYGSWLAGYNRGFCYGWLEAFGNSLHQSTPPFPLPPFDSLDGGDAASGAEPPGRPYDRDLGTDRDSEPPAGAVGAT